MVSNLIGDLDDKAHDMVVDDAKDKITEAQDWLAGQKRAEIDIDKEEAKFIPGESLTSPDGAPPTTAAPPNPIGAGSTASKSAAISTGKQIEFIHFGRVHNDFARNFHHDELNDLSPDDITGLVGSRAIAFRAALQREAILLAGFARAAQLALEEKADKEGAMTDILTAAADLLGGSAGTANTATSADLTPFLVKIESAWDPINVSTIKYEDLHAAGIALHEVRANLRAYLRGQLDAAANPPAGGPGMLENLPLIGTGIPIPGVLGDILAFMKKITGKLHDVQIGLIYRLVLEMQGAIETASHAASIDAIRRKSSPMYPIWSPPPKAEGPGRGDFANYQQGDVIQGQLKEIEALNSINQGVQDGVGAYNNALNEATEKPFKAIDFLSKPVDPAPGSPFLADAFGVQPDTTGALVSGEALGKVALAAFGEAIGNGDAPGFLNGFVGTIVQEVFHICAEFLRGVYGKLCCIPNSHLVTTDEIVAAGREHLLFQLIDLALEKTGIDKLLDELTFKIPTPPFPAPPGASWPTDTLSAAPIVAELKGLLSEKLGPYLDPVVGYAMNGLAERLNASRNWASYPGMTMEVHLAQLPTELALMFRNLFGPLWEFLTDTLMGLIEKAVAEVMGPLADAVGLGQDKLAFIQDKIADAEKKAKQAQAYAKNIEDKAKDLMDKASNMQIGTGDTSDIDAVKNAAGALGDAVDQDPFKNGGGGGGPPPGADGGGEFPSNRKHKGKGNKIDKAQLDKVKPNHKMEQAKADATDSADAAAQTDADAAAGGSSDGSST